MRLFYSPKYKNQFYEVPYKETGEINEDLDYILVEDGAERYFELRHPNEPKNMSDENFLELINGEYSDLLFGYTVPTHMDPKSINLPDGAFDNIHKAITEILKMEFGKMTRLDRRIEIEKRLKPIVTKLGLNIDELKFIAVFLSDLDNFMSKVRNSPCFRGFRPR